MFSRKNNADNSVETVEEKKLGRVIHFTPVGNFLYNCTSMASSNNMSSDIFLENQETKNGVLISGTFVSIQGTGKELQDLTELYTDGNYKIIPGFFE